MQVTTDTRHLSAAPGEFAKFVVDVVNTEAVIDGVGARVLGVPEQSVTYQPVLLALFPEASGKLAISVAVPPGLHAGRHPLTVEVVSHGANAPAQYLDVDLDVSPQPALQLSARPRMIRARRSARFVLELINGGNVPLEITLRASDADRSLTCRFSSDEVALAPGASSAVLLTVRGPRMISGGEIDRSLNVIATGRRLDLDPDVIEQSAVGLTRSAPLQLRQRPLLSRGLMTALILASIVALWAGAFLLGLSKVFSQDPMTKAAPASFYAGTKVSAIAALDAAGQPQQVSAPVGSLPKVGALPTGIAAQISGTVIAASDGQPVGRILVDAIRVRDGKQLVVSSSATQADGTFVIGGLFPVSYYLRFSAPGYTTRWYPSASSITHAAQVPTNAQGTTTSTPVVITGAAASISGAIDPGDSLVPVVTTVSARPLIGGTTHPVATTVSDASGAYHLANLPAPATYELTFKAQGYQATSLVDHVGGGEARHEATVTLGASDGQITGLVTDGAAPIGGAVITTTVRGQPLTVMTPTIGQVGFYSLQHLPTPGTYVITFSAPGHGAKTRIVDLPAGGTQTRLDTTLIAGTGSVTGRVVDESGGGLGGATIAVGGATTATGGPPSTTTLTSGAVGSFAINGLIAPGTYTITATLPGFGATTAPFTLGADGAPATVTIHLSKNVGTLTGQVTGPCDQPGCVGATITATDGTQSFTTTVGAPGGRLPGGGYLIDAIAPGTYSVTVSLKGMSPQTAMVTVSAGSTTTQNLKLGG